MNALELSRCICGHVSAPVPWNSQLYRRFGLNSGAHIAWAAQLRQDEASSLLRNSAPAADVVGLLFQSLTFVAISFWRSDGST
jgi:hypothetical protein